jgi:hypothetical protein
VKQVIEAAFGFLLLAGMAYLGWRWLLLGHALRRKVMGEPEAPITIFTFKKKK